MKLEIKDISKKFGDNTIIQDVNLEFVGGNIYGFVGKNGSGKSVFLKMICGFYAPSTGSISLDGRDYTGKNEFPENTRALIEKPKFLPDLTGYENLELLASVQNKIGKEEIEKFLEKMNLKADQNKNYSKYSLGMKQKLGIAQVLMEDPQMIILDEPFNGVEKDTAACIRELLREEKARGKIIIIASHIKEDIDELADIVYEVDGGKITKYS